MCLIAGDSIIDWIIKDKQVRPMVGGAGNIVRGLTNLGHNVQFLTVYNPMLYPMSYALNLHPLSLTDFDHRNVFIRDYDRGIFHRFRENLKTNVLDVKGATAVICHEDSVIRRFTAFYADVRDTSVRGHCEILRMSSSDNYKAIMENISHKIAIVTYHDRVEVKGMLVDYPNVWHSIEFEQVGAVDDIGAGDTFDVGFLDIILQSDLTDLEKAIRRGIYLAQEKVTSIGVFMDA